SFQ
ncbi:nuclear export protein, partial [Influenza A virus (A/turkey/France/05045/2005(H1N2))]